MRMKHFLATGVLGMLSAISMASAVADDGLRAHAILGSSPFAHANYGNNVVRGSATLSSEEHGTSITIRIPLKG